MLYLCHLSQNKMTLNNRESEIDRQKSQQPYAYARLNEKRTQLNVKWNNLSLKIKTDKTLLLCNVNMSHLFGYMHVPCYILGENTLSTYIKSSV